MHPLSYATGIIIIGIFSIHSGITDVIVTLKCTLSWYFWYWYCKQLIVPTVGTTLCTKNEVSHEGFLQ